MEFIVACDKNWGIGKGGAMLDHLPKDLAFFKEKTSGHVIVMGRKTLESFPGGKPLSNRVNIVLTSQRHYPAAEGVTLVHSLPALVQTLEELGRDDVYLVGGAMLYKMLKDVCTGGYVTHIDHAYEDVEVYFPNLDEDVNWKLEEMLSETEDAGKHLRFCYWHNKDVKKWEDII